MSIEFNLFEQPSSSKLPKGKSLLHVPSDYISIDLETTGFDYYYCDIIEIAAVRVKDNKIIDQFQTLVNPQGEIDEFISDLTGITNDMVADAPMLDEVIQNFLDYIGEELLLAHNVNFDINFLSRKLDMMEMAPILNDFVDTLRLSRWFFKDYANHKLDTIARNLGIERLARHRALDDSITTKGVVDKIHEHIRDNNIDTKEFFKYARSGHKLDAKSITTANTEFDIEHPLYDKNVVFTGKLEKMVRKEAMQLVIDLGGCCQNGVNKETNILIMGNNDFCSTIKDGKSSKQKKAEGYILKGQDFIIIAENTFYDLI